MIYAVIDTNVIVSAYITKNLLASTSKVWAAVLQGKIIPVYSDEIIDEYIEVKDTTMKRIRLFILACLSLLTVRAQDSGFSIDTISDAVFLRMQGRSFPANCSTPRSDLRYLRVLHRNAEDSVRCGELVCNKAIAEDLLDIFKQLYDAHYPIEHIRLIDDYEADDELSMRDNNSSSFCYRLFISHGFTWGGHWRTMKDYQHFEK